MAEGRDVTGRRSATGDRPADGGIAVVPAATCPLAGRRNIMIFGEYLAHDPATPLQLFRHHGRQDWVGDGDLMIANLARTMRLAPVPHYMVWWRINGPCADRRVGGLFPQSARTALSGRDGGDPRRPLPAERRLRRNHRRRRVAVAAGPASRRILLERHDRGRRPPRNAYEARAARSTGGQASTRSEAPRHAGAGSWRSGVVVVCQPRRGGAVPAVASCPPTD